MSLLGLRRSAGIFSALLPPPIYKASSSAFHQSRSLRGLEEFFESGLSLPPFDPAEKKSFGRAWSPDELRLKSFDDLHKLWFVLLKEVNLLTTQQAEAIRLGQRWFGMHRVHKCRLSMARVKTVLTERLNLHVKAKEVLSLQSSPPSEGDLILKFQKSDKMRQLWRKRKFRKKMNYRTARQPLFI